MASKKRGEVGKGAGRIATGIRGDVPSRSATVRPARRRVMPDWRWRSFPVFAALVTGVLIDSLINPPTNEAGEVLRIVALLGFGYVLAHLFVTNVVIAGRIRRREKAIARGETPEEDFVEEAVYPEEAATTTQQSNRSSGH